MSHRIHPLLLGCYDAFTHKFTFASYSTKLSYRESMADLKPILDIPSPLSSRRRGPRTVITDSSPVKNHASGTTRQQAIMRRTCPGAARSDIAARKSLRLGLTSEVARAVDGLQDLVGVVEDGVCTA
eukprot:154695-Hanusia_phi.AAC.1